MRELIYSAMRTANIFQLNNKNNRTEERKGERKEGIVKEIRKKSGRTKG